MVAPGDELQVDGLGVRYGSVCALENVSFQISGGRTVALLGKNGAGKSTLLKVLAGLISPVEGTVRWKDSVVARNHKEIAYLPQREQVDWDFPLTVRGLVEMGRYPLLGLWRRFSRHDSEVVSKAITAVGMNELQERQISCLSGGQQQRAFLARALAQEAKVLLLDEPFSGLDKAASETLTAVFHGLADQGCLLIVSHHHLESAAEIFDEALILNQSPVAFGSTREVLTSENLLKAFAT